MAAWICSYSQSRTPSIRVRDTETQQPTGSIGGHPFAAPLRSASGILKHILPGLPPEHPCGRAAPLRSASGILKLYGVRAVFRADHVAAPLRSASGILKPVRSAL